MIWLTSLGDFNEPLNLAANYSGVNPTAFVKEPPCLTFLFGMIFIRLEFVRF
jgi:hypothetical protein